MAQEVFKVVNAIQFELLSPKIIQQSSTVKVVTPELYDKEGYPVDGGLMDTRMGVINPGVRCRTCGGSIGECPGHFGFIELARPVLHIKFIPYVEQFLKNTCANCGRVLLTDNLIESARKIYERSSKIEGESIAKKRLKTFLTKNVSKTCPHCETKVKKISLKKPYSFYEDDSVMNPIEIRSRLERINDEDLFLFSFNTSFARPEWMILTILPVPPVTVRPSITIESGEKSEDDLTHKLGEIVRINQRLFENINAGAPEVIVDDLWDLLQYHVATYYDNTAAQLPVSKLRGGNLAVKSLVERLKTKSGRIRLNLLGKRVNFSSRSVISPDPMLKLNELGVPEEVARELTVPEYVTEWNTEYIKQFILNGTEKYPGSNYVIRPDGRRKRINAETKEQIIEELQPGYMVERHLMDGDITIFNRQPSLHKHSMMAMYTKVLPGKTFRLNPAVCFPYNADFDGDEMNLHLPQTIEAQAEARMLMDVNKLLVTPKNGEVIIGISVDAITGNYLLSRFLELNKEEAVNLLMSAGIMDLSRLENKETYHGSELYSTVFPEDFEFEDTIKGVKVLIEKGKIIEGYLTKPLLGSGTGKLIRKLYTTYGDEKSSEIIERMFRLGLKTLSKFGFSISLSDMNIPKESQKKVDDIWSKCEKEVEILLKEFETDKFELIPGKTKEETLDQKMQALLDQARTDIGNAIGENADELSSLIVMFKSGAKGNILNLAQIAGLVGQQSLRGQRINYGYRNRSLSSFKENDLSAKSRGFIQSNFRRGLKPEEFFFQSITGRDGLMDMGLRTPKSGYLYRRLSTSMQDFYMNYDGTIKDSSKMIVQFEYGGDGLDVAKTDKGKLNVNEIIKDYVKQQKKAKN